MTKLLSTWNVHMSNEQIVHKGLCYLCDFVICKII